MGQKLSLLFKNLDFYLSLSGKSLTFANRFLLRSHAFDVAPADGDMPDCQLNDVMFNIKSPQKRNVFRSKQEG